MIAIPADAERELRGANLLPSSGGGPTLPPDPPDDLVVRARGTLIGGAIGDALGRPGEARSRESVRAHHGLLTDFLPWPGHRSGPVGTITDDTQLTMVVAHALAAGRGVLDPADLGARYADWLGHGRGVGQATRAACGRLQGSEPWWRAGTPSAGNGDAMRTAPIGIVHCTEPDALRLAAALSAVPTHRDPTAVAGAIVHAAAVAWLTHRTGPLDPDEFVTALVGTLDGVHDPGVVHRRDASGDAVALVDRIREVPGLLGRPADDVFDHFYNGALVTESLPCAVWCFLEYADDPETMLVTAASGGHDSDTIAAMAGAYAGALGGEDAFPTRWRSDLEHVDELRALADLLAGLASTDARTGDDPVRREVNARNTPIPVPVPGAPWFGAVAQFALTYNGYLRHGDARGAASITRRVRDQWRRDGSFDGCTVDEIRCALFTTQRSHRHFDTVPRGRDRRFVDAALVALIARTGGAIGEEPDPLP